MPATNIKRRIAHVYAAAKTSRNGFLLENNEIATATV